MQYFAIELDDRALSMATGGRVLSSTPSAVFDGTAGGAMGADAWDELRLRPRAISTNHLSSVLAQRGASARAEALVEAELKVRLARQDLRPAADPTESMAEEQRIWIVAPAQVEATGLTALLGITRRLGLPVDGFVDAATVITAALGSAQNAIVLELGLHHAAATFVDCDGSQARRRRVVHTERGGLIELYQVWLDLISTTLVKRTRFDPLHDAATEQQVFDSIPALALEAARTGGATASVSKGTGRFEAELTRDQFAQAAQPIYRAIVGLLHQLRPAGVPVDIFMPQMAAHLPGLREQLEQFVGCELVSVPDGFAAAATSMLDLPEAAADERGVSLLRRLPMRPQSPPFDGPQASAVAIDASAGADAHVATDGSDTTAAAQENTVNEAPPDAQVSREPLGQRRTGGPAPSHVLWDGRAYSIHADSLVVGRGQSNSCFITLPDGLAGVSRRHCTFIHDGNELVLLDHSTFGTFVNGERVQERVRIYAGDSVRLGEPGVELTLIAVGDGPRADSQTKLNSQP
jgi:hypothetical protein